MEGATRRHRETRHRLGLARAYLLAPLDPRGAVRHVWDPRGHACESDSGPVRPLDIRLSGVSYRHVTWAA